MAQAKTKIVSEKSLLIAIRDNNNNNVPPKTAVPNFAAVRESMNLVSLLTKEKK